MPILTKITDLLYRRQKAIEIIAIFLFFSLVGFRFDSKKVKLFWSDYPSVAILLALTIAFIVVIWLRIEKQKTQLLINRLQKENTEKSIKIESKLSELSLRQKAVFNLIVKGKSNKEITAELNIELSTLKTHINQIYKILGIRSRGKQKFLKMKQIPLIKPFFNPSINPFSTPYYFHLIFDGHTFAATNNCRTKN